MNNFTFKTYCCEIASYIFGVARVVVQKWSLVGHSIYLLVVTNKYLLF